MPRRALILALLAAALSPAAAEAAFFRGEAVDGPNPAIQSLGGVDIARDGTGTLVYLRSDQGQDHVFASRFVNGAWEAPERVDNGLGGRSSQPVVTAVAGGRTVIAFVNAGAVWAVVRPAGASAWPGPTLVAGQPGALQGLTNPSVDMSINGVAYLVYSGPGASPADVGAARLVGDSWSVVPAPLDVDPSRPAGDGPARRPRVGVSADNNAVATWGETAADGRDRVYARRLTLTTPSGSPQQVSIEGFEDRPPGPADSPEIEIEDDNSYAWVAFRQTFLDAGVPRSRGIARRLVGSNFEAPVAIDSLAFPTGEDAETPRIDLTGRGEGLASAGVGPGGATAASAIFNDVFQRPARLDTQGSDTPARPVPAVGENVDGLVAWQRERGGGREVVAREFDAQTRERPSSFGPETLISNGDLGAVDASLGLDAAADRSGNVAVVFVQGGPGDRRIVSAFLDRPPTRPLGRNTTKWRRASRPKFVWVGAGDWATVQYDVRLDGRVIAQTSEPTFTPRTRLRDGNHSWRITARDRRGQVTSGLTRRLRIDSRAPRLRVSVRGARRRGRALRISASASDGAGRSGVKTVRIDFGDRTRVVAARSAMHRYRRGTFTLRVSATDGAGNAAVRRIRLRIR